MKGNPTAGIILLVAASLFIALGTKYRDRVKGAWNMLINGGSSSNNVGSGNTTGAGGVKLPTGGGGNLGSQGGANS